MDRAAALAKLTVTIHDAIMGCRVLQQGQPRDEYLEQCDESLRDALVAAAQASREVNR